MSEVHASEVQSGDRFEFGRNWSRFLSELDDSRIAIAENSLRAMLNVQSLAGKRFLDIGSGSGLFSLAARRLGAEVRSFDFDPYSVECTRQLRSRYFPEDSGWLVEEGSILDKGLVSSLGEWDIVYSWGVLHHTGDMTTALQNASRLVAPGGSLFIALYNDQGRASRTWLRVKKAYNGLPGVTKWFVLLPAAVRLWGPTMVRDLLGGRPFESWRTYRHTSLRGMSPWRDVVDWVGGLPFEVAKPEQVFTFFRDRGFELRELRTVAGGLGCNEFVFQRRS